MSIAKLTELLTQRLRCDQFSLAEGTLNEYAKDETGVYQALPGMLVFPEKKEEISFILESCNKLGIPITPRGAGTGLAGNSVSFPGGVLLVLTKMDQIISLDSENGTVTVQPGCIVDNLKEYVARHGWYYPVDPASSGTSLIGGHVSTNAAGPHSYKYGSTKNFVAGLEVVLADGTLIHTGNVVEKSSTGYNLTQLICGSEGTLGIITEITLRLVRPPSLQNTILISFAALEDGLNTIIALKKSRLNIAAIEWMERSAIDIVALYEGKQEINIETNCSCHLLIDMESDSVEEMESNILNLGSLMETLPYINILVSDSEQSREKLWRIRKLIGVAVRHHSTYREVDTVVPVNKLIELIHLVKETGIKYNFHSVCYGHAGNGNIHVNILREDLDDYVWNHVLTEGVHAIFEGVIALNGVLSGEHGIGLLNRPFMPLQFTKDEILLMRQIKKAFDPNNILNRDKVIP
ncbi:MAG TPA: FAD-binding oxidoreductase [Saprospiraceae bacterium]|nr:FAD-binding oxidoreductase [Saprospiraceae bacterium]